MLRPDDKERLLKQQPKELAANQFHWKVNECMDMDEKQETLKHRHNVPRGHKETITSER